MVLQVLHRSPRPGEAGRRIERIPDGIEVDAGLAADGGLANGATDGRAEASAPDAIEARAAATGRLDHPGLVGIPVFGDVDDLGVGEVERVGQVLAEPPAAEAVDDGHLVVAEAVD